jgi:hypothetical protein
VSIISFAALETGLSVLTDSDLKAANTKAASLRVKPIRLSGVAVGAETVRMELPPA